MIKQVRQFISKLTICIYWCPFFATCCQQQPQLLPLHLGHLPDNRNDDHTHLYAQQETERITKYHTFANSAGNDP